MRVRVFSTPQTAARALALDAGGAAYYAPLVRDEIRKYGPGGQLLWSAKRGLYPSEPDPVFLPAKGTELRLRSALVNVALALGPDGRLYALGADDSAATRLRVDVLDTATGAIVLTRHLGARETAVPKIWLQMKGVDAALQARLNEIARGLEGTELRDCPQ